MKRLRAIAAILYLATATAAATDQVGLPQLPGVPPLPVPNLPGTVSDTLRTAQTAIPLADVRRLQVRDLLRRERETVEADPDGQPILRRQVGALSPSAEALARAKDAGFTIQSER